MMKKILYVRPNPNGKMDGQQEYKQCLLETRHGQLLRPQLFALLHAYIVHKRLLISDCVTMIHPSFSPFAYIHARTYTQSHKGLMKSKGIQKPTKLGKLMEDPNTGIVATVSIA